MIRIPLSFIWEMDDVGWDNGDDLSVYGKASRSGIPRYHTVEDYEFINSLSKATGKRVAAALCLGDWDKENFLRGAVGVTHDPYGWDRKSEIDIEKFTRYRDLLDAGHIDFILHGIMHGRYAEDGKHITEIEFYQYEKQPDGTRIEVFDEDDFRRRLDLFFKIYNSWGFEQKIRAFIHPCHTPFDEEIQRKMARILREYGIIYWADNFRFPEEVRVTEGVAMFKWSHNAGAIPWDAYDADPTLLGNVWREDSDENSCLHGSHWTNHLRFNPKRNAENVKPWADFLNGQGEVFGTVLADTLEDGVNQLFYHQFAKAVIEGDTVTVDLTDVLENKLDCHKNEFLISMTKDVTPKCCEGGDISLYEEHGNFNTYKVRHTEGKITIKI